MAKLIDLKFDDTAGSGSADDYAGPDANDGTFFNGATTGGTGTAVFDGVDDYLSIPSDPALGLSEGTIVLEFTQDTLSSGSNPYGSSAAQTLFSVDSTGLDGGGHLTIYTLPSGEVAVRHQTATGEEFFTGGAITLGQPVSVAYSWSPTGSTLVVDGVVVATGTTAHTMAGDVEPIVLGASQAQSGDGSADNLQGYFDGEIERFRLYDTAIAGAGPVPCFGRGTLIGTPGGLVAVERLKEGDLVETADCGPRPIRAVLRTDLGASELAAQPRLRPVIIPRGVLGARFDLVLSRQHAVCLSRKSGPVLIRAAHLARDFGHGIRVANGCRRASYFHLLLDDHHVVSANGVPCETLYLGPEVLCARPDLARIGHHKDRCAPLLSGHEARLLIANLRTTAAGRARALPLTVAVGPGPIGVGWALSGNGACKALANP